MKLLVLSIDAMFSEDVEKLKRYDALAPFFERAPLPRTWPRSILH